MTQEQLADAIETDRGTINGYCTGRLDLGITNARKIAAVLGVSVLELGAPEEEDDEKGRLLRNRLDELATKLGDMMERETKTRQEVRRLQARVRALEGERGAAAIAARDQ